MKIICLLLIIAFTEAVENEWIDPYEMKIDTKYNQRSVSDSNQVCTRSGGKCLDTIKSPCAEETSVSVYLKRIVGLILSSANPENGNPNAYTGQYRYTLESEEYKFLKDFTTNEKIDEEDLRRLDTTLSDIFSKPYFNRLFNMTAENLINSMLRMKISIVIVIGSCLYIFYKLLINNHGFVYIILYSIWTVFLIDFGLRYIDKYEKAEQYNLNRENIFDCDTDDLNWTEYIKVASGQKKCDKKTVLPLDILLDQMKQVIVILMESLGIGTGKLGYKLWGELPTPSKVVIFPIMLCFILLAPFMVGMAWKGVALVFNQAPAKRLENGRRRRISKR